MKKVIVAPYQVIGIRVRTTNQNNQAAKDIGELWGRFMNEEIASKIPNKTSEDILSIYTNYEGDHTQPYDTILGCKVSSLDKIPEGMIGQTFEGGNFQKFISKGNLTQGVVFQTWLEIWNQPLDRNYVADFEVYGQKSQNPMDAEVEIFVGLTD